MTDINTTATVAVIVAMQKELDLLLPMIRDLVTRESDGIVFHEGQIDGQTVVAMKCGIGKVNAALGSENLIRLYRPSLVINTGVAGGTGSSAGILDVVVADEVAYHDVWCGPGTEPGQAAGCPPRFVCDKRITSIPTLYDLPGVRHGLIASGDIFVSRQEEVERIRSIYPDVMAVDMESAAIAHVCTLTSTPFVCVRVISDTPGGADNISQYADFWDDAPRHTFDILTFILSRLPDKL